MSISAKCADYLYPIVIGSVIGLCNVGGGGVVIGLTGLVAVWIFFSIVYFSYRRFRDEGSDDQESRLEEQLLKQDEENEQEKKKEEEEEEEEKEVISTVTRLDYLDNLKSFLTLLVVVHHCTGTFVGGKSWYYSVGSYLNSFQIFGGSLLLLNQSYFMCLFFFISGYFTPISFKRKGRRRFLQERFKRLGIPFLLFFFGLGPLSIMFRDHVIMNRNVTYMPEPGPPWFLAWLLIFNSAYAFIGNDEASIQSRNKLHQSATAFVSSSVLILSISGACIGLLQAVQMIVAPAFVLMPITFGSLPFDYFFFAAGLVAKEQRWLEDVIPTFCEKKRIALRTISLLIVVGIVTLESVLYQTGGGYALMPRNACDEKPNRGTTSDTWHEKDSTLHLVLFIIMGGIVTGIFCIIFSMVLLDFFRQNCNVKNSATIFFSSTSYAVYLIHPPVILIFTYAWIKIMRSYDSDIDLTYFHDENESSTCLNSERNIWFGWIFVVMTTLSAVYPLGYVIKKLPIARGII